MERSSQVVEYPEIKIKTVLRWFVHPSAPAKGHRFTAGGLYGTSNIEVATWYAKADGQRKYSKDTVLLDGREVDYNFSDDGNSFEDIKRSTLLDVRRHKGDIDAVITEYQGDIEEDVYSEDDVEWLKTSIDFLENNRDRITYRPAGDDTMKRHIYSQTFWPGKNEVLIDWYKEVPQDIRQKIADQAVKEGLPFAYTENGKNVLNESGTGKFVYNAWVKPYNQLGSPQAASEFLYRAGIDGVTYIGDSSGVRNYVAFSDQDIRVDEYYRFLLAEFSPEERRDITLVLKPFVGFTLDHPDNICQKYLADRGIAVSQGDAHAFVVTAMRENIGDANKRSAEKRKSAQEAARKRRKEWFYENIPLYREAVDFAGSDDFKIKPSARFRGEEFSGSFKLKGDMNFYHKPMQIQKNDSSFCCRLKIEDGGWRWIRTTESIASRFTVCPL